VTTLLSPVSKRERRKQEPASEGHQGILCMRSRTNLGSLSPSLEVEDRQTKSQSVSQPDIHAAAAAAARTHTRDFAGNLCGWMGDGGEKGVANN
jgi:hypothetical protein